ncbi:hypothetical protein BJX63DRAFT_432417 [Aspergillus granulosus]|uniref:Uncharacterized protein n=1 Tax=Aspergillus granulosus TaxID=176169 RepID=A0ABR4HBF5_9EURO
MHYLRYIALGLMSTIGVMGVEVTATVNKTEIQLAADQLLSIFPSATPFTADFTVPGGNLIQPPSSIIPDIITGIPPSILAQLLIPSSRSSIASEVQAGNTPDWYNDLPSEVRSYVTAIRSQVAAGNLNLSATPTPAPTSASSEDSGSGDSENGNSPASETSSGLAARATGEVAASLVTVLGLAGIAGLLRTPSLWI